ncbi:winged helix-turn-helix domain-containing protein [Moorena producens]|uniref:winged helix-turn-helix domain-containing protein n=1 Tax=Moorena producens TaxID=1155739 RepID=UPI003C74CF14
MGKRLTIADHLTEEEIEQYYRISTDGIERSQWQIIWLLKKGKKREEVALVTGYSVPWIRVIARRFNFGGVEAIGDGRHQNPGAKPLLNDIQQAQLMQALEGEAPGGGKWNGPKVALWMSQLLGRRIRPQRGWEYLKGLEYGIKVPRPAHTQADQREQQKWKKKLSNVESNWKNNKENKYEYGQWMSIASDSNQW